MSSTQLLTAFSLAAAAYFVYTLKAVGHHEQHLPPGPPTLPLLGNIHVFPTKLIHLKFTEWAKTYGDIFSIKIGPQTMIVVSSAAVAKEILDKRAATTSDRLPMHIVDELNQGNYMALARYGPLWKAQRKAANSILSPQGVARLLPIQTAESKQLMFDILTRPQDFYESTKRYTSSVILSVVYGRRSPQYTTPETVASYEAVEMVAQLMLPGAAPPVDLLPILKYIPERFASWKTQVKIIREKQRTLYFGLLEELEKRVARGGANGCFMETVVQQAAECGLDREAIGYLGNALIDGGTETTSGVLLTIMLALVTHPEVQRKAQDEIDRVVGPDRTPTLDDFPHLPYCQAIINEAYRWRPALPLGLPHATTRDETYNGYVIPKGTAIIANIWAMAHDPEVFDDPDEFKPERYLANEFGSKPEAHDGDKDRRNNFTFGYGRRLCPGLYVAANSIQYNTMQLLWGFNFFKATNPESGAEIELDVWDYLDAVAMFPNSYQCRIVCRSPRHAEIIRREFADATTAFEPFECELNAEDRAFVEEQRKHL